MALIKVEMRPFAKARPRVTRGGQHTYMPPKYEESRDTLRALWAAAGGSLDHDGPLKLFVLFRFKIARSWPKYKKKALVGRFHTQKPDLDNLVGAVMDALVEDDTKVVVIDATKVWGLEDAIYISLGPAEAQLA